MSETPSTVNFAQLPAEGLKTADRARALDRLGRAHAHLTEISRRAMAVTLQNSPDFSAGDVQAFIESLDDMTPALPSAISWTDAELLTILRSRAASALSAKKAGSTLEGARGASIRFGETAAFAGLPANDVAAARPIDLTPGNAAGEVNEYAGPSVSLYDLPLPVSEKLLSAHGDDIAHTLILKHDLPAHLATDLCGRAHGRALADICGQAGGREAIKNFTAELMGTGRLTSAVIARLACAGQMEFAEYSLAVRAGITPAKASLMMYAPGALSLSELLRAACIGRLDAHLLRGAIVTYRHLESSGAEYDCAYFQRLMIHRILNLDVEFSDADGDYLLEALDGLGVSEFY